MQVRPVRLPQDAAALGLMDISVTASVILEVTATVEGFEWARVPVQPPITKGSDLLDVLTSPQRDWSHGWVAVVDEGLVGFAAGRYLSWNRRQVLAHLYVDRASRRRGVARALLQVVESAARQQGARQVWLETQNVNLPAVHAYQALGFEIVGLDRTFYDGAGGPRGRAVHGQAPQRRQLSEPQRVGGRRQTMCPTSEATRTAS